MVGAGRTNQKVPGGAVEEGRDAGSECEDLRESLKGLCTEVTLSDSQFNEISRVDVFVLYGKPGFAKYENIYWVSG